MILVDTSILIGYFKGIDTEPYQKLDSLIDNDIPFGICNPVYQEILQGAKNMSEFKLLREYLDRLTIYDLRYGKKSYEMAALMYYKCRKAGITPRSTVDMIIAQTAIDNNLLLFHNDTDFIKIASVVTDLKLLSPEAI
ncbi:PIN domain nuclease [Chryseobacterium taklimakanense]|uniref:type II toxin-antitoxin system VapC family toxin n=1 Tax=Chryseobacterium taklimakanense TaxID=536441 RepID=UPI001EF3F410|nr:PIN domain nuclease [Chryseobacterium taklimakanense]MCG7281915.1 PIN domain nuclease [Chryseobacterium taklimakanense]